MVIASQLYIHYSAKTSIFIYLPFFQSISIYSHYAWHWLPHCRTSLWMLNALSFFSCMVPARTWFDWLFPSWAGVKRFVYISAADFGLVNYLLQGYYEGKVCLFFFSSIKKNANFKDFCIITWGYWYPSSHDVPIGMPFCQSAWPKNDIPYVSTSSMG